MRTFLRINGNCCAAGEFLPDRLGMRSGAPACRMGRSFLSCTRWKVRRSSLAISDFAVALFAILITASFVWRCPPRRQQVSSAVSSAIHRFGRRRIAWVRFFGSAKWELLSGDCILTRKRKRVGPAKRKNQSRFGRPVMGRGLGRLGGAQGVEKCLARACGFEGLVKILRRGEINPALLDQLGARLVSESVPHHAYDLLLGKGLLLRPSREGKDQPRRQNEKCQCFAESHCHLAHFAWTEKNRWGDYTENGQAWREPDT